ncbi:MAG: carbohydrate ABC transporter substrate-binding protein [Treponema sp.]|nr:carbohydrate ABC transporter substrate-binding protein [Treponema sp.]
MKKILSVMCALLVASSVFGAAKKATPVTINLWAFTDEVPGMVEKYLANNPSVNAKLNTTIIATTDGAYQPALNEALKNGEVDLYAAEAAFILKYSKGDMSEFAAPYKDFGIKIDKAIKDADIASYTVDIGSNEKGQVVGLGYQATGGCFIYNRSVAKKVFGSDDPKTVQAAIGGGSQSWDKFWDAAKKCADNGVAIVSGDGDIWHAIENSSDKGWIVDDQLYLDPKREAFLDVSKNLTDNGWSNKTQDWTDAWYADMAELGAKPVLGFFGPAWLINYVMAGNSKDTYGDWAVCNSPIGFFWGGTWVLGSKVAAKDKNKKAICKGIIEWITLDTSNTGLLYHWANGTLNGPGGTKDTVSSGTVMSKSDGKLEFLGGQNMFDYFVPAGAYANGKNLTQYDEEINSIWRDQVRAYANGQKSRADAIKDFKQTVADKLGY